MPAYQPQQVNQSGGSVVQSHYLLQLLAPLLQQLGLQGFGTQPPQQIPQQQSGMPISAATGQPFPLLTTTPTADPGTGVIKGGPGYYGPEAGIGLESPSNVYSSTEIAAAAQVGAPKAAGKGGFDIAKFQKQLGGSNQNTQQSNPAYSAPIYETFLRPQR